MTQYDPVIGDDASGQTYREADNQFKQALLSQHKGDTAPVYAVPGTMWIDDTDTPWTLKIYDGEGWIFIGEIDPDNDEFKMSERSGKTVGEFFWHLGTTPPDGALVCNGQDVSDLYPDLKAFLVDQGNPFGTANGNPLLPDMEMANRFIRAAGGDINVGDLQDDAFQGHVHDTEGSGGAAQNGRNYLQTRGTLDGGSFNVETKAPSSDGVNGAPRTADETRPVNIALLPCVQAFGAVNVEGMADLSELLNAIATQAEAEAGTGDGLMTAELTKQAIDALNPDNGIGVDQTWQNVNGSRSPNTVYQNTTGKPIQVYASTGGNSPFFQVSQDSVSWVNISFSASSEAAQIYIIVPDGHYYRLNGSDVISNWVELRG